MSLKPADVWANNEINIEKPTQPQIDDGFVCGPANPDHMNWILYMLSKCLVGNTHKWDLDVATEGGYIHPQVVVGSDGEFYQTVIGGDYTNDPVGDGGTNWLPYNFVLLNQSYIEGMTLEFVDPTNVVFSTGAARDFSNSVDMFALSAKTKDISLNWAEGTGVGGRASSTPLTPSTWYRAFAIARPDGVTDFGFDQATNASGLLADAAPFGYTVYRRCGWVYVDALSQIREFTHDTNDQNRYAWDYLSTDINTAVVGIGVRSLFTMSIPPECTGHFQATMWDTNPAILQLIFTQTNQPDIAPGGTEGRHLITYNGDLQDSSTFMLQVDTLSQIGARRTLAGVLNILLVMTLGWYDERRTI